jgi:tetratricopeptide (TPR) repeat protein
MRFLEEAATREPDLALVWHEVGYAAFRLGEHTRALLALDRAFALEPHGATLHLRGQVLREAGQYLAAEVAFDAAAEAAEFPSQRHEAEQEVLVTRRAGTFGGRRPCELTASERWFMETGAVVLASPGNPPGATDIEKVQAFAELARRAGWAFTAVVPMDEWSGWDRLAADLRIPSVRTDGGLPRGVTLVVARRAPDAGQDGTPVSLLSRGGRGLSFVLEQPEDAVAADVAGQVGPADDVVIDLEAALRMASHPEGRLAGRALR